MFGSCRHGDPYDRCPTCVKETDALRKKIDEALKKDPLLFYREPIEIPRSAFVDEATTYTAEEFECLFPEKGRNLKPLKGKRLERWLRRVRAWCIRKLRARAPE